METYCSYRDGGEPPGSIVVRLVRTAEEVRGTVFEVPEPGEEDATFPSEEVPAEEALRLARNKRGDAPDAAPVLIELGPGVTWDERWGRLV